jgi:hypothetical protein
MEHRASRIPKREDDDLLQFAADTKPIGDAAPSKTHPASSENENGKNPLIDRHHPRIR